MSTGNINLAINGRANTAQALAQIEALRKSMMVASVQAAKFQKQITYDAKVDRKGYQDLQAQIGNIRNEYRDALQMSGQYASATRNVTAETTKFNEALARQKVGFRDVWGIRQQRLIRDAMKEQMALNNMMVSGWTKDATGKINADFYVPKGVEVRRLESMRAQMGYYREILRSVSTETVNWGKNTQWAGRQLTVGFSVPLSIAAGFMAKFALEADEGLTRIAKVYGDNENAFQASNDSIRSMAQETAVYIAEQYGMAAQDTRNIMAELAATGLEGPELQKMTVLTQETSLLGEMSGDDSLKLMRTLKEVYGFSTAELEKQRNYFNAIENSTALTMQDVTEGLPRIAGIMKATGTSITEQTELLVAFKAAGIDVAEGATALKSINFKAVAASPTAAKSFLRITGVEMQDLIDKTEGRFVPMMREIAEVMKGLDQQADVDLVARIFGIHQGSRALTLLDQLQNGSESLFRAQEVGTRSAAEHARVADREIATIQESASNRFKVIVQSIRTSAEQIGAPLLEMLLPVGQAISKALSWFTKLDEGTQKLALFGAGLLMVTGPIIMLSGLFLNLFGMMGRGVAGILGLAGTFKVLNPLEKVAALLQDKFATSTQKATMATNEHANATNRLAEAMQKLAAQHVSDLNLVDSDIALQEAARTGVTPSTGAYGPMTEAQYKRERSMIGVGTWRANPGAIPTTGPDTYASHVRKQKKAGVTGFPKEAAEYNRAYAQTQEAIEVSSKRAYEAQRRSMMAMNSGVQAVEKQKVAVKELQQRWTGVGRGIAVASGGILGLGMLMNNETMTNVGGYAMAISSIAPMFTMMSDRFKKSALQMGQHTGKTRKFMVGAFKEIGSMGAKSMAGALSVLTGPVGLLAAGAIAGLTALWLKNKKEVEANVEMYKRLADTSGSMSNIYGFTPSTPLERETERDIYGSEDGAHEQRLRINKMKEEEAELYGDLTKFAKNAVDEVGEAANRTEILAEAIAQGRAVLQQTGDPELAKRAAWDVYTVMSGEFMSFDSFKISVKLDGQSVDTLLSDLSRASELASTRIAAKMAGVEVQGFFNPRVYKEDQAAMEAELSKTLDSVLQIVNDKSRRDALQAAIGKEAGTIADLYSKGVAEGTVAAGETGMDFIKGLMEDRQRAMDEVAAGGTPTALALIPHDEVVRIQAVALAMAGYDEDLINMIVSNEDYIDTYAGLENAVDMYIDKKQEQIYIDELAAAQNRDDTAGAAAAQKNLDALRAQAGATKEVVDRQQGHTSMFYKNSDAADQNTDELLENADAIEEVKTALEMLNDEQRAAYDAFSDASSYGTGLMVDIYEKRFEDMQSAESEAFEKGADQLIQDVNDEYDALDESAEKRAEARLKTLERQHDAERKALDKEREAANDALDDANDAAVDAIEARKDAAAAAQKNESKALTMRFKTLGEELEDKQEARREKIEAGYDRQIEAIQNQISEEQRLEELRQKAFEAEQTRISRLQQMFSSNIDLNMAINSGDLDEAARVASQMNAESANWATQDLSEISAAGSEKKIGDKEGKIEKIEAAKEAELEAISEVEEVEKEALARREEAAELALEKKYERIEKELQAERDKQAELFEMQKEAHDAEFEQRGEALDNRQNRQQEHLDETLEMEAATRSTNRESALVMQEQENEDNRAALVQRQEDAKASFDVTAEHWRNMTFRNRQDALRKNGQMAVDFGEHTGEIERINYESMDNIMGKTEEKFKNTMDELDNQELWEKFADRIADGLLEGTFGFKGWNAKDRGKFVTTGLLPKGETGTRFSRTGAVMLHSGGVVGKDNSPTGPGFTGKHQEMNITALKGEGVLNLRAMNTPGVPGLLSALNSGAVSGESNFTDRVSGNRAGGSGGAGLLGGLTGALPQLMAGFTGQMLLAGLESGVNKAMARMSGVDIRLGKEERQGLDDEQLKNASSVVSVGKRMGATSRDIITALMTAMQESSLRNLGYGDDIYGVTNSDGSLTSSVGLFQQQKWWGTKKDRMDPEKSSELFYKALFQVPDREKMGLSQAAQAVQGSAYPGAYAKWESLARVLLGGAQINEEGINFNMTNAKRIEELAKGMKEVKEADSGLMIPTTGMVSWLYGWRNMFADGPDMHNAIDIRAPGGTGVYSSLAGRASTGWDSTGGGNFVKVDHGNGLATMYLHLSKKIAENGEMVKRGQHIGAVGNTGGRSLGNHLHWMVLKNGTVIDPNTQLNPKLKVGDQVRPSMIGLNGGGTVPGQGFTDSVRAMLTPQEFVVNRKDALANEPLLKAINNGAKVDFMPNMNSLSPASPTSSFDRGVDNGAGNSYYVNIDFSGPVASDVDVEKVVARTIRQAERSKTPKRSVTR